MGGLTAAREADNTHAMGYTRTKKGRFTVTEVAAGEAQPMAVCGLPSQPLQPIYEAPVVCKGRFRVLTSCLPCISPATKHDEELPLMPALKASHGALRDAAPSRDQARMPHPPPLAFDEGRISWESTSSGRSSTFSFDSAQPPRVDKARRCVRFSEPDGSFSTPGSSAPASPVPSPLQQHQQQVLSGASLGSGRDMPRAAMRSYQRGRFQVQEALLQAPAGAWPCPGPNAAQQHQMLLHRSCSLPEYGDLAQAARGGAAAADALAPLTVRGACAPLWQPVDTLVGFGQEDGAGGGIGGAAGDAHVAGAELNRAPGGRQHHSVSYCRRGRFLVATTLHA